MSMNSVRFHGADEEQSQVERDQVLFVIIKSAGGDDDSASKSLQTLRPAFSPFLCSPLFNKPNCFQLSISTEAWSDSVFLISVLLFAGMSFRCRDHASCRPVLTMIRPPYPCQYMVNILPIYVSPLVQAEQLPIANCHGSLVQFLVYVICLLLVGISFHRRDHVSCPRPNGRLPVVYVTIS